MHHSKHPYQSTLHPTLASPSVPPLTLSSSQINDHDTTSPAEDDFVPFEDANTPNGSTYANPSSTTSRDMATMSGFVPAPVTTADGTAECTSSAALSGTIASPSSAGVQSMPGACAMPGMPKVDMVIMHVCACRVKEPDSQIYVLLVPVPGKSHGLLLDSIIVIYQRCVAW